MNNKEQFELFLKNSGISDSTAKKYASCVGGKLTDFIKNHVENIISLYDITDVSKLNVLLDSLTKIQSFNDYNSKVKSMYLAAFKWYIKYCQSLQK